jgi:aminopeptidase N
MISRIIGAASQLTEGDEATHALVQKLRIRLARHWYDILGWDDKSVDDVNTKQLRHTALALMLGGEDENALAEAMKRYKAATTIHGLPAETRSSILSVVVRKGTRKDIDTLLTLYPDASPDVQLDICSALSSTKDSKTAEYIFAKALGPKGFVRPQDVLRWIALFLRNRFTRSVTWQLMIDQWDWLRSALNTSKSFVYLPTYCASIINTPEWAKKYHDFFEPLKSIKALERNILVGISDIESRVAWRKRDEAGIKAWLKNN